MTSEKKPTEAEAGRAQPEAGQSQAASQREALGVGSVFVAELVTLPGGDRVVEKRLLPRLREDDRAKFCLVREAKVLSVLDHPRTPRLLGVGSDSRGPVLRQTWIEGTSLRVLTDRWSAEGIPAILRRHLAHRIACTIAELHQQDNGRLVHADLSPDDLIVMPHADIAVVDFGLARASSLSLAETDDGRGGTLPYVAPELCRQEQSPSQATDRYAAAVIIAQLLLGAQLLTGNEAHLLSTIGETGHPREQLTSLGSLGGPLLALLEPDASRRPTSFAALRSALET